MGRVRVAGDQILLEQIEGDEALKQALAALAEGANVVLEIGGILGRWERTQGEFEGRAVAAMKPSAEVREAWARKGGRPDGLVDIRRGATPQNSLATFGLRAVEWDIPDNQIR